jgi:hypothetical protein
MGWDPFFGSRRSSPDGKGVPAQCTENGARGVSNDIKDEFENLADKLGVGPQGKR